MLVRGLAGSCAGIATVVRLLLQQSFQLGPRLINHRRRKPARGFLPLAPAAGSKAVTILPAQVLPRLPGKHDLCLRFARPRLDPMWALDWIEIGG